MNKEIHNGHRTRLKNKYLSHEDVLEDYELLELLLTYCIPRKDTNALAHTLTERFGSLEKIIKSGFDTLLSIEGVGESTACFLSAIGSVYNRINTKQFKNIEVFTIENAKEPLIKLYRNVDHEIFYIFHLDKNNKLINFYKIDSNERSKVMLNLDEIIRSVILNKPCSVVVAHNHFSKFPRPSESDDEATKRIYMLLQLQKVNFYDHLIVSGNEIYSYFYDNRLQQIKNEVNNKLI